MLLNKLFLVENIESRPTERGTTITALLEINPAHPVFEGHFPGQPVMPGVCMMQCILELCEQANGKRYRLQEAASLKFLTVLNPTVQPTVRAEIDLTDGENSQSLKAKLYWESVVFFKMEGIIISLHP